MDLNDLERFKRGVEIMREIESVNRYSQETLKKTYNYDYYSFQSFDTYYLSNEAFDKIKEIILLDCERIKKTTRNRI